MYIYYDTQSSFPGYIDMEFKELVDNPPKQYSGTLDWEDIFEAVLDGYYYDGVAHYIPKYMEEVFDIEGDHKAARVSKRLVKKWCKRVE